MASLLARVPASEAARERARVMLLTLSGDWSVRVGFEHLGMRRTRFQDLRRRMLRAAVEALEGGLAGRPRRPVACDSMRIYELRQQVEALTHELHLTRTQLEIAESGAGQAVRERRKQMLAQGAWRRL